MNQTMTSGEVVPFRVGEWLPSDQAVLEQWLAERIAEAEKELAEARPPNRVR